MQRVVVDPISNRQDWIEQVEVFDEFNNLVDLTGADIVLALADKRPSSAWNTSASSTTPLMLARTADGTIIIQGLGVFQFTFPVSLMRSLCASKQYEVGCTIQINGVIQQFFTGTVAVLDGIVP
jgi:hypothetical protein